MTSLMKEPNSNIDLAFEPLERPHIDMRKARNWCFTAYESDEVQALINWDKKKYLIVGEETCPTTGRKHYQGYMELKTPYGMKSIKNYITRECYHTSNTHFEPRRGSQLEAILYCKKDGAYTEYGEKHEEKVQFSADMTDAEIATTWPHRCKALMDAKRVIEAEKSFSSFWGTLGTPRREPLKYCLYICGKSGAGKTRAAWTLAKNEYGDDYTKVSQFQFEHGFLNAVNPLAECLICNEFRDGNVRVADFLELTDPYYPMIANIKGGKVHIMPKWVVICSIKRLGELYSNVCEDRQQFIRRFKVLDADFFQQVTDQSLSSLFGLCATRVVSGISSDSVDDSLLDSPTQGTGAVISDSVCSEGAEN